MLTTAIASVVILLSKTIMKNSLYFSGNSWSWRCCLFLFLRTVFKATNGYLVNLDKKGVIIEGYDPVAYFTDNKPVKGSEQFTAQFESATIGLLQLNMLICLRKIQEVCPSIWSLLRYAVSIGKLRPVDPLIYQLKMAVLFFSTHRKRMIFLIRFKKQYDKSR